VGEKNTGTNLPAQIEIYADGRDAYKFLFMAKGGGSANKSFLFQETKALLNPTAAGVPRREDPHARHRRLPALPPRHRHRRHVGRVT
jgi:fumarate hydratase, class I